MRKLFALLLTLCLAAGILSAGAESETETRLPAEAYDFHFTLQLHPESFLPEEAERIQGYADLLNALTFQGSMIRAKSGEVFTLQLSIIPLNRDASPVDLEIHGTEHRMYLRSNLMGDKTVTLNNYSLLAFCAKMSEHLGLSLQYPALLYPYTWSYCLGLPLQDWEGMVEKMDENGVIPADAVKYLWDCWFYRVFADEPLEILVSALCKGSAYEDAFRGLVAEIPDYFVKQVAQEQEIRIVQEGNRKTWITASGPIFTEYDDGVTSEQELTLPRMQTGYLPVFARETTRENGFYTTRLKAQLLGEGDERPDLLNLQASLISFPETWPVNSYSLLSLNLTGGLLPNIGVSVYLSAQEDGHFESAIRKPTVGEEPGAVMLSAEGNLFPRSGEETIRVYSPEEMEGSLDLFVSNDADIQLFIPDLVEPMMKGLVFFLIGIPTNACQTVMDDLTDLGVFNVLLGQ